MGAELTVVLEGALGVVDADAELMLRFQAGENACFDLLVARYRQPLMGFVYRMVHDAAASEELIQEAFLRVFQHRQRYSPKARFSTWIYRIANHLALNYIRDHRRDVRHESLDAAAETDATPRELPDGRATVEQELIHAARERERQRRIRLAVSALPERQRTAVIMHKYQNLEYEVIGGTLGLSPSATKSLLFRAYETLRRELRDLI